MCMYKDVQINWMITSLIKIVNLCGLGYFSAQVLSLFSVRSKGYESYLRGRLITT